ncbi:3-deoxy-D-manno-octulosonic-acid transferase [Comamonas sp. BIGb0124]|uniref:3-deoxy-D-manno-octulosonic acid transferase n=1 Tax=Comamonas sp. BIGb0124 TaxID=2485130 RepID=UPI000F486507|nr:3-deoxy-D-manno-octulosonic acid transferase [Comamonas sp. BIGb0124]ROR23153.1 3-deoxy-D-manno-octulosonic-acid transferase [Comamonas sp. BIGb0124]
MAPGDRPLPSQSLSRRFYSVLTWLVQPLLRRKLRRRGQAEPGYLMRIDERFGRYDAEMRAALARRAGAPRLWIHAVSLGETRAAAILVPALRERWPGVQLLLTHSTATGRAEGQRLMREGDLQLWLPWDTPACVGRFVQAARPDLGLVMETEVWPNLMAACRTAGVPAVLVNARLNDKSLRGAQRWPALMAPAYAGFTRILAQSDEDAARLRLAGGVDVVVTGNLKYDARPSMPQLEKAARWRAGLDKPVVMLASSREGEEQALLARLAALREAGTWVDAVQWMIVPRHPQRFDAVRVLAEQAGWHVSVRSGWDDARGPAGTAATASVRRPVLWLGDTLGEMALYYGLADLALLGGSFEPLGGQNLIEAAACACPVVMGPHTFNFAEAAQLAESAGAARRVADLAQALDRVRELVLEQPAGLQAMRAASQDFAQHRRGAVSATVRELASLLPL